MKTKKLLKLTLGLMLTATMFVSCTEGDENCNCTQVTVNTETGTVVQTSDNTFPSLPGAVCDYANTIVETTVEGVLYEVTTTCAGTDAPSTTDVD
ncbi:hypothetical protein [Polaribacter sp. Asnod1-A03]|uniref:hypothetical protein n=1 Tax=Polaribacter sp. Asnod1-A03 TaxID=3160581 RepID=UPI0038699203